MTALRTPRKIEGPYEARLADHLLTTYLLIERLVTSGQGLSFSSIVVEFRGR